MIEIKNLTKYYGNFLAVDNVNFKINKGEVLGLLGPNGAGKTTTIRMLCCYLAPTQGDITVKDLSINDDPIDIKNMIGYLPESAPLYNDMLVYDYLQYIATIRQIPTEQIESRIKELANICGLNEKMHQNINDLSKGFKQRVGLAHAMMNNPEILVLDEPTSGLDPNQIVEIRELIRKIGQEKTVILSSHILSEIEATCDRVVIINRGKLVANETVRELIAGNDAQKILQLELDGVTGDIAASELRSIGGVEDVSVDSVASGRLTVKSSASSDIRADIFNMAKDKNWTLLTMYQEEKSLENIFRELTKD